MPRSRLTRRLLATTLPMAMIAATPSGVALAEPALVMNSYGLPGAIDTPTAQRLPDGTLGATISKSDYAQRNNVVFQAMPRVTTVLRYSRIEGINDHNNMGHIWDRSFDLRFHALDEDREGWRPAVAIGLQDFLGTGVYSGEYIVATKTLTPRLRASVGIGWGTLAGNPRVLDVDDTGGRPRVDDWFRGSPKPFASVAWQATDRVTLVAEYSNDIYAADHRLRNGTIARVQQGDDEPGSRLNFGAYYSFGNGYQAGIYTIGGDTIGAQFSFSLNPREAPYPSGLE
ncbi:MAG: YjbH domain-containing protein, partial [Paracoccus sp. (in: a-proteobacteria)]|nr:YjbH domain-containing protein [Paracoccus sp. (in: a-proteobacteria)]